jgi:hypothetical protein
LTLKREPLLAYRSRRGRGNKRWVAREDKDLVLLVARRSVRLTSCFTTLNEFCLLDPRVGGVRATLPEAHTRAPGPNGWSILPPFAGRPFFELGQSDTSNPIKRVFYCPPIDSRGSMNYADMNIPISPPLLDYSPRWSWEQLSPRVWDLGKQNCMAPVEIPTILWSSISP